MCSTAVTRCPPTPFHAIMQVAHHDTVLLQCSCAGRVDAALHRSCTPPPRACYAMICCAG
jgi:hypothetical protein